MAAEQIGKARCPLCASEKATLSLSKKGLACLTCMGCSCQIFARSERSDEKLRALAIGAKPPEAPPAPASKPAAKKVEAPPSDARAVADAWDPFR